MTLPETKPAAQTPQTPSAEIETTFQAALPYGAGCLVIGAIGAITAVAAVTTIVKIIGISMGIIGAYGFLGTLFCGITHSGDPKTFRLELPKYVTTMIGQALAEIIKKVAVDVLQALIDNALGRKPVHIRF